MTFRNRQFLGIFSSLFLMPAAALAASDGVPDKLCPAATQEKSYGKGVEGYKYVIAGKDGWIFRTNSDLQQDYTLDEKTLEMLKRFHKAMKDKGTEVAIVVQPTRGIMGAEYLNFDDDKLQGFDPQQAEATYRTRIQQLKDIGFITVDLTRAPRGTSYYLKRDPHWTAEGADYSARAIADEIIRAGVIRDVPKKSFVTEVQQEDANEMGSLGDFAARLCSLEIEPEYSPVVTTTMQGDTEVSEEALFGDGDVPQVVLVGTSNSTRSRSNFDGALRSHLGVEVRNEAVTGGGLDTAALDYLSSQDFHDNPPRLLVWELPGQYNMENFSFLRQLLSSAEGCDAQTATAPVSAALEDGAVLFTGDEKTPEYTHVHMRLNQNVPDKLYAMINYEDGYEKKYNLVSSERMKTRDFYFELMQSKSRAVDEVVLQTDEDAVGTVEARLCRYKDVEAANQEKQAGKKSDPSLFDKIKAFLKRVV